MAMLRSWLWCLVWLALLHAVFAGPPGQGRHHTGYGSSSSKGRWGQSGHWNWQQSQPHYPHPTEVVVRVEDGKSLRKTKQKRRRSAPPALPLPSLILRIAGPRANGAAKARGKRPRVRTYWAKKTLKNFNNFAVRRKSRRSETKFWLAYPVGPALPAKVRQRQSQTKCLVTRLQKLFPLRPR